MVRIVKTIVFVLRRLVLYRSTDKPASFSFGWFSFFIALQATAVAGLIYWIAPAQFNFPWYLLVLWFICLHAVLGMFEFFFHRYVLHTTIWEALGSFKEKHTEHHLLTPVPSKNLGYPIVEPEQVESSAFPAYSLVVFWAVFAVPFGLLQWIWPNQPILLAGALAVVFSLYLYEVKHALEHLPYEEHWKKWVDRYVFVRRWYGFHQIHHAKIKANMAIGGFFGFPIWDRIWGCYYVPANLPPPVGTASRQELIPPIPRKPIALLDQWAVNRLRKRSGHT